MAVGITRNGDDRANTFFGTPDDDTLRGNGGNDKLYARAGNDFLAGGTGNDLIYGEAGHDRIFGGADNDTIYAGAGDDTINLNVSTGGSDTVYFGDGSDVARITAASAGQVRLTFTSSEVGNGTGLDSDSMPNQDGGLAVRLQTENGSGNLTGPISRLGDESVTFVSGTAGLTFDVRDLVSGTARGDDFEVVVLGTEDDDKLTAIQADRPYYFNAGMGNDMVSGGRAADFLVGGAGNDTLSGRGGNDSFIGGGGNDRIFAGAGNDTINFNVSTDGSDRIDLGDGSDVVLVSAASAGQVRLTFTSSEVGNATGLDSNTMANQDGGLAVRLQAEDGSDGLTGPVSRVGDESVTFVSGTPGLSFDVRDLVSGTERGDDFEVVTLGTEQNDKLVALQGARPYYINAGMGNDTVIGGSASDFLVGGAGSDLLSGKGAADSFIGGGGDDRIFGGAGDDTVIFNVSTDGSDRVDLGTGSDVVRVGAAAAGQVRLTFTSAEVGNGTGLDSDAMMNQDGGLAVRLQAEDGSDGLSGPISRFGDEGITFVSTTAGLTFDIRDLVSGAARGDQFEVVRLGTIGDDALAALELARPYYINAGMGNDTVTGGTQEDFLVGGAGDDTLNGLEGSDSFIGGGGNDDLTGGAGMDSFIFAAALDNTTNVDSIGDFSHDDDTIRLDDAFFTDLMPGPLDPEAFARSTELPENDDRIIYDQTTGNLFFDENGGLRTDAVLFARLENSPANLDASDFVVI